MLRALTYIMKHSAQRVLHKSTCIWFLTMLLPLLNVANFIKLKD